ncbi:MAG: FKBP-type peptidyl-prolyl cis-trans isomerase [Vicingaceae bacterium]
MKALFYSLIIVTFFACSDTPKEFPVVDMNKIQADLLEANKRAITKESEQIDAYVASKNYEVIKTQTGLRYVIYHNNEGENIKPKQTAVVKYKVNLLDGTECYATGNEVETFIVNKDEVETGLHEGIQLMSKGDKAIMILPSHLAHGLAGDLKKIPYKSSIVYDVELVEIK